MLPYSVEYAPLFEQTTSATPSFSASSTLLKSVDCNSFVVRNIHTLCKAMGGYTPLDPISELSSDDDRALHPLFRTPYTLRPL